MPQELAGMYPNTTARPFGDRRAVLRKGIAALGASLIGIALFATPAHAAGIGLNSFDPANLATTSVDNVLPLWYQDADGQKLTVCRVAGVCGAPVVGEDFYWSGVATAAGVDLTLAQEATGAPGPGSIGMLGRVRIKSKSPSLTPGDWYRFTYPYGQVDLQAGTDPAKPQINSTVDIGCGPAPSCATNADFALTAGSEVGPNFLQWDTGVSSPPVVGGVQYIGDGATPHAVVGSTFFAPGESTPANYFRVDHIAGPGGGVLGTVEQTNLFTIIGQLQDPATVVGSLVNSSTDFGAHRVNAGAITKSVTLRNGGSGAVDIASIVINGADASQFIKGAGCTATQALDATTSCVVSVSFVPTGNAGARKASLDITENVLGLAAGGAPIVKSFPLIGTATLPIVSAAPGQGIDFGNQAVGSLTGPRRVTLSNTGTDALSVTTASIAGAGAGDYTLGLNTCNAASVAPGGSCTVDVNFTPLSTGSKPATVSIATELGAQTVAISGIGVTLPVAPVVIPTTPLVVPVFASAGSKLSLTRLTVSSRIKRSNAKKKGIRIVIGVPKGATVVRIRIIRKFSGGGTKLLSDGFRSPSKAGLYRVSQNFSALRAAFGSPGNYEVEVTPGAGKTDLGNTKHKSFKIIPG